MSKRAIIAFHQDEDDDWVANLACGHRQHVRHKPPFEERVWVTSEEGRAGHLGQEVDCLFCNMPSLPEGAQVYGQTREFDSTTVPKGLLQEHTTKEGTWGRIVVEEGRLLYTIGGESWLLSPEVVGIVAPTVEHHISPQGAVRFRVEFLRVEKEDAD